MPTSFNLFICLPNLQELLKTIQYLKQTLKTMYVHITYLS